MTNSRNVVTLLFLLFGIFSLSRTATIQDILNDPKAIQMGIACVLDRGVCVGYGKALKNAIREVLVNGCRSCNEKQKINARKVIEFMQQNYKREWNEILAKYQPNPQG